MLPFCITHNGISRVQFVLLTVLFSLYAKFVCLYIVYANLKLHKNSCSSKKCALTQLVVLLDIPFDKLY